MKSYVDGLVLVVLLTLGFASGIYGAYRAREAFRFDKKPEPMVLRFEQKPECSPGLAALVGVAPVAASSSCREAEFRLAEVK